MGGEVALDDPSAESLTPTSQGGGPPAIQLQDIEWRLAFADASDTARGPDPSDPVVNVDRKYDRAAIDRPGPDLLPAINFPSGNCRDRSRPAEARQEL